MPYVEYVGVSDITAFSALSEIKAVYLDNASFEEDASPTKARTFVTACRALLLKMPSQSGHGGDNIQLKPELIKQELDHARGWLSANDTNTNAGVRHMSFEGLRR